MRVDPKSVTEKKSRRLSLDGWAVLVDFAAALLIRAGWLKHVPW